MTVSGTELIRRARAGDRAALGELMDRYRPWLKVLAERELGGQVGARLDDSDLAQKTLLSAVRQFDRFRGSGERELVAWIRKIHERCIVDTFQQHVAAQKRSVNREEIVEGADVAEWADASGQQSSPSRRTMLGEDAVRLSRALDRLPDDQREAIRLRHLEGLTLAELTEQLGRSRAAVAGLLQRGLSNLRKQLAEQTE